MSAPQQPSSTSSSADRRSRPQPADGGDTTDRNMHIETVEPDDKPQR